jgi:phosphate uptake regulator
MQIRPQSFLLRSHLLRMAMLSQKAVDYSIKAHELGVPEIYALFWKNDQEWRILQRRIGERGRRLCASGTPVDYDSKVANCALKIYSALHVTYTASCEIAQVGAQISMSGRTNRLPCLRANARFVNSLVRLSTVAFFNREAQYAKSILNDLSGSRWSELRLCHTHHSVMRNSGAEARIELAVARALEQIAEQAYEIAQTFALCFEGDDRLGSECEKLNLAA